MAGQRSSSDEDRKLEAGVAHSQAPEPAASSGGGLHPAFYIALWITLSSSIIIFNKWILTTAKFGRPVSAVLPLRLILNEPLLTSTLFCPDFRAYCLLLDSLFPLCATHQQPLTFSDSALLDNMAPDLRHHHDPVHGPLHQDARLAPQGPHDQGDIYVRTTPVQKIDGKQEALTNCCSQASYCPNWLDVQSYPY